MVETGAGPHIKNLITQLLRLLFAVRKAFLRL
jgi:hypothetical protein